MCNRKRIMQIDLHLSELLQKLKWPSLWHALVNETAGFISVIMFSMTAEFIIEYNTQFVICFLVDAGVMWS